MIVNTEAIERDIKHADEMREKYRRKDKELYKQWKQTAYRLRSDLLSAQRINQAAS